MDLSNLRPAAGSRRPRKRLGRGIGSGTGKTSGRGHKGRGARSGGNTPPGYEGGQMPLQRRLPKFGFTNPTRVTYEIITLSQLDRFAAGSVVDVEALVGAGLVRKGRPVKLLGNGAVSRPVTLKIDKASASARAAVVAAGGSVETPGTGAAQEG
ncbi:MAG: 50S ribosomal protein L15 [Polyangiaceae bacterium UTPRO1]|nr:MAG: 50S ribosomal protein L15 [Polyangiaceae bacterium UTPRO1]